MRLKKLRGNKRRIKEIDEWIELSTDLNIDFLKEYTYYYQKIEVQPWCNLSILNSEFPEPRSIIKNKIINGLETIYNSWRAELEKLNEPYYLKIWLYEPRISKSQVVCALQDRINYYEEQFNRITEEQKPSDLLKKFSSNINWEPAVDEEIYNESDLSTERKFYINDESFLYDKRLLKRLKNGNYRQEKLDINNNKDNLFYVPVGNLWIGGKK